MHSTSVGNSGVPAFLVKLWKLVEDRDYDDLICWNSNGTSFFIRDQQRFSRELLPQYFKHSNMASFIRQLNMYGFHKVVNIESGGLRVDKDEMEFRHNYFLKGNDNLLERIKRKVPSGKSVPPAEETKPQPDLVNKMMFDVKNLHGKQESLNSKLDNIKRENETLWREVAALRQQHLKQQQIIQKLIQFFIGLVQPNRGMGVGMKRKMPLMLDSASHSDVKCNRLSRTLSFDPGSGGASNAQNVASSSGTSLSANGPVIHDITDCADAENFLNTGSDVVLRLTSGDYASPSPAADPIVNSPAPSTGERPDDGHFSGTLLDSTAADEDRSMDAVMGVVASSSSNDDHGDKPSNLDEFFKEISNDYPVLQISATEAASESPNPSASTLKRAISKVDFVDHIDTVNLELDALKDMISNGDFTIDASTLMGLFSVDENLPGKSLADMGDFGKFHMGNEIVGNELAQFTAGPFELDESEVNPFAQDDLPEVTEGLSLGQDGIYDYASVVSLEDDDKDGTAGACAPLSTDLALTSDLDLDLFVETPNLLEEDVNVLPGRRKDVTAPPPKTYAPRK